MVEVHDHKLEDIIIDGLGGDISGLPVFLLTKYIAHEDMKAQICTDRQMHAQMHTLRSGADSIDGSLGHRTDASVSVPLTLDTHNFK